MVIDFRSDLGKNKANSVALTPPIDFRFGYSFSRSPQRVRKHAHHCVCMNARKEPGSVKSENDKY